jgi:hypothetical protein
MSFAPTDKGAAPIEFAMYGKKDHSSSAFSIRPTAPPQHVGIFNLTRLLRHG